MKFFWGICLLAPVWAICGEWGYALQDANGEYLDRKLINQVFKGMENGVFVEVGAHDGVVQSNTCLLEKEFGWTGVLIEPSENTYQKLCENRPNAYRFQCALGSFSEDNTYILGDFGSGLMSSVGGVRLNQTPTKKVLVRSLQSILDEVGITHVDFFSLDTEGYEYNILQGIDFDKTTFNYLLIEVYSWDYDTICAFLDQKGYEMVECFSLYNHVTNPGWDGTHNDYLFRRRNLVVNE